MDENALDRAFRDELGLAIEAAMGIEPAPELKVHVHARIDRERATVRRWMPWQLATIAAAAVLIAAMTFTSWRRDHEADRPSTRDRGRLQQRAGAVCGGVTSGRAGDRPACRPSESDRSGAIEPSGAARRLHESPSSTSHHSASPCSPSVW